MKKQWLFIVGLAFLMVGYIVLVKKGLIFAFPLLAAGIALSLYWTNKNFSYFCTRCGHVFDISLLTQLFSFNGFGTKYLRCPSCEQTSWCKTVPKGFGQQKEKKEDE